MIEHAIYQGLNLIRFVRDDGQVDLGFDVAPPLATCWFAVSSMFLAISNTEFARRLKHTAHTGTTTGRTVRQESIQIAAVLQDTIVLVATCIKLIIKPFSNRYQNS